MVHLLRYLLAVGQLQTLQQLCCSLPLTPFDLTTTIEAAGGASHDLDVLRMCGGGVCQSELTNQEVICSEYPTST